ncbi:MAG: GNAT family N-acetyltransferase [Oscillospiraceae bacterium]
MDITIRKGETGDINAIASFYDSVNDALAKGYNYPGWQKGVYPTINEAEIGVKSGSIFLALYNGEIAGTIILNHEAESDYNKIKWQIACDYSEILMMHTFAVSPLYRHCGIGKAIFDFAEGYAIENKLKAIRFDVNENNLPAIKLYEKCGYMHMGTMDLGYGGYGLNMFRLYEKLITP